MNETMQYSYLFYNSVTTHDVDAVEIVSTCILKCDWPL